MKNSPWKYYIPAIVSAVVAIGEVVGWEIKRILYFGEVYSHELAVEFWNHDYPHWRLIQLSVFFVFAGISIILWNKGRKLNSFSSGKENPSSPSINEAAPRLSILALFGLIFSVLFPIVGLILSIFALKKINNGDGKLTGRGLAITGIWISGVGLLLMFILLSAG